MAGLSSVGIWPSRPGQTAVRALNKFKLVVSYSFQRSRKGIRAAPSMRLLLFPHFSLPGHPVCCLWFTPRYDSGRIITGSREGSSRPAGQCLQVSQLGSGYFPFTS